MNALPRPGRETAVEMNEPREIKVPLLFSPGFAKWALLFPVLAYLAVFFAYPLVKMFIFSLFDPGMTFRHYARIHQNELYPRVIWVTFRLALVCTLSALLLGYPIAYLLNRVSPGVRNILMLCVVLPFWTSLLVRIYAWMVILGRYGVINSLLLDLGLTAAPINLLYNTFSVTLGMVHFLLPFMIFALYSAMNGIDKDLVKAAYNLGAGPFRAFFKIFLPLSLPGVGAGSLIVFILSLGFFITPALLGGRQDLVISMLIENQVNVQLNWPFASALGFALLAATLVLFNIANRFLGVGRIWGARS
ncbi:MAG: ABC transporter permease [Thermodesulfobacteriota bacterium]